MHITRCLTPRPHNSGEAPCSFTMDPCVVVERLEGKQQCSRAPVGEHAEVQAQDAECSCHEQQEVNEKRPKPRNSPSHNHDSTAPRQHPLTCTGAGPIHPVHGPLRSPATEAIAPKGFTFSMTVSAVVAACRKRLSLQHSERGEYFHANPPDRMQTPSDRVK